MLKTSRSIAGLFVIVLVLLPLLTACGGGTPPAANEDAPAEDTATEEEAAADTEEATDPEEEATADDETAATKEAAITTYADIAYASYVDSYQTALELQEAINAFVAEPTAQTHESAKQAWLAAQEPYGQTEVYRFYGGPIDDEDGPEGLLNSWPLDEVYVDYVEGETDSGIINNPDEYPEITQELLVELNQVGSEESVSTGYHAIEFLLWGQDLSTDGSGDRPFTDYIAGDEGTAANQERRADYLVAATDLLLVHLDEMQQAWTPDVADNYRSEFLAMEPDTAIQNILTGMGVLSKSELAGERMFTAYDNQDQEDEHSCFSDNTHRDIITNAQGIRNVYEGTYAGLTPETTVEGTGLQAVVAAADADLNDQMLTLLEQSLENANQIYVPFDQAIVLPEERPVVLDAVTVLQDQGDTIAEIGSALGFSINTALP